MFSYNLANFLALLSIQLALLFRGGDHQLLWLCLGEKKNNHKYKAELQDSYLSLDG